MTSSNATIAHIEDKGRSTRSRSRSRCCGWAMDFPGLDESAVVAAHRRVRRRATPSSAKLQRLDGESKAATTFLRGLWYEVVDKSGLQTGHEGRVIVAARTDWCDAAQSREARWRDGEVALRFALRRRVSPYGSPASVSASSAARMSTVHCASASVPAAAERIPDGGTAFSWARSTRANV